MVKKIFLGLALLVVVGLALVAQGIAACPFCPAAADLHRAINAGQTRSVSYHTLSEIKLPDDARS